MQKKITRVRYPYLRKRIAEFILEMGIKAFPVNPYLIIDNNGWTRRTFKFYAQKHEVSIRNVIEAYETEDGFTTYINGRYSIAFNDLVRSPGRIHFTLMHEIGHIYLKHLEEFDQTILARGGLTDEEYEILEKEAHIFASEVLSPQSVLLALDWDNYSIIKKYCGLSLKAAQTRASQISDLKSGKSKSSSINFALPIIANFHDFIYQKRCPHCGYGFVSEDAKYCPICRRKIIWGEGKMIYEGFRLDKNNKALVCPRCGDEEPHDQGDYCPICGVYLINKCDDIMDSNGHGNVWIEKAGCGTLAAGNARFCIHCGNPTTFYHADLLKDWDEVQKKPNGRNVE